MQYRVGQGHRLPERRQQGDGVKHPAQVGQRREHEGRDDGNIIEVACEHGVDKAQQREDRRRQHDHQNGDPQVMHLQVGKEQGQQRHDHSHHQATQHAAQGVADEDGVR